MTKESFISQIITIDITSEIIQKAKSFADERKKRAELEKMHTKFDDKNDNFAWELGELIFESFLIQKGANYNRDDKRNFHDKYDFKINNKTIDVKTAEMKKNYWEDILSRFFYWDNYLPRDQYPEKKDFIVIIRYSLHTMKAYIIGYIPGSLIINFTPVVTPVAWGNTAKYPIANYVIPLKEHRNIIEII